MSLALTMSRCQSGMDALPISVETHLSNGLPTFTIVGLPETAVRESRERVRSALINSGFEFPQRRITVNLAPGDIPKEGTRFDLAIAIGILAASQQVPSAALGTVEFVAELALDGGLRAVGSTLSAALAARAVRRQLVVADADASEAALIADADIRPATSLAAVCGHLRGERMLQVAAAMRPLDNVPAWPDLADVVGQARARRALEIAAAGRHNLLLIGPPGTGKSMLATRLPGLLPALTEAEAVEVATVHSLARQPMRRAQWHVRPFRAPHHSASAAALIGGGRSPRPGEISLAHRGVLFLDELPEFDRRAIECLREPLESGAITVARAEQVLVFPAAFQLVAAMNPCPCGYHGDARNQCLCSPERIAAYRARISGPLAERIDLHVEVPRQTGDLVWARGVPAEGTAPVRARVERAQARQVSRQGTLNAVLSGSALLEHCTLTHEARHLLAQAAERLGLSARGHHKVLRLALTIADLSEAAQVEEAHVAEGISFRVLDRRSASR